MTWRDDDISVLTNVVDFKKVHEIFNEYKQIHTIAILTKDLHKNTELVNYINSQDDIDIQVHAHEHIDFVFASNDEVRNQLNTCALTIEALFNVTPTVFYPPFNSCDERVIRIAKECGLKTSYEKVSPVYYMKHNGNVMHDVVNFHYHDYIEAILIGPCLKIYTQK